MPIPSFDELLQQAKAIGESKRPSTGYKAVSGGFQFLDKLLNTEAQPRETYGGYVNSGGLTPFEGGPRSSGGTAMQQLFGGPRMKTGDVPSGALPVKRGEMLEFLKPKTMDSGDKPFSAVYPGKTDKELEQITGIPGVTASMTFDQASTIKRPDKTLAQERMAATEEQREFQRTQTIASNQSRVIDRYNSDSSVKKAQTSIDAASMIKDLAESGNPIGAAAIPTFSARMAGEVGALSEADKRPFGGSSAIANRVEAALKQMSDGKLTEENRKFIVELTDIIKNRAKKNKKSMARQYARQKSKIKNHGTEDEIFEQLYQDDGQDSADSILAEFGLQGK